MMNILPVAAIQMISIADIDQNLDAADHWIAEAARQGAKLAVLPENWAFMGNDERDKLAFSEPYGQGPLQSFMQEQARRTNLWLVGGTIPLKAPRDNQVYNSCLIYGPDGICVARYDKIHLFDVDISEEESGAYRESNTIAPGDEVVVAKTPYGNLGMSICYDLRFPEIYRRMLEDNISIITVPSAFTDVTGEKHWEPLLRARAIENLCYVIAANQGGQNTENRGTWGHSMIVSPWGDILATMEKGAGVICAELDLHSLQNLRQRFPSLQHKRLLN